MRTQRLGVWLAGALALGGAMVVAQTPQPAPPPAQGTPDPAAAGRQGAGRGRGRSVSIGVGEECPPGMTETRPRECQPPEFTPPSIVDYRPKSTLVTAQHLVPKAKYPAIDFHGHAPGGTWASQESLAAMVKQLDSINVGLFVAADNVNGPNLATALDTIAKSPYKDRFRVLTGIQFSEGGRGQPQRWLVGPGFAEKAIAQLEANLKAGAVGIGEISKGFGLTAKKANESRLAVDDPELDAVWEACARLKIPVFIHTAEPQEFFQQPDMHNERWLELALFGDRRNYQPGQVSFEQLMTERDNLFRKHPKTTFVAAHFGWHANNLERAAKLLDQFPNVVYEVGAVLYDFGRQPRAAREFFIKYQDRILFGKDSFQPEEYPYYWRVFETNDEYFDYYRDYHAFWKLYGLGLPDEVLKKLYYKNALRITPGLPQSGWPK